MNIILIKKKNFIVTIISILILWIFLAFFDLLYSIDKKSKQVDSFLLFSKLQNGKEINSNIFSKINNIWVYENNVLIRHTKFFYKKRLYKKEYDYFFRTNNYGLVQYNDIFPDKESILFLGDSFLEGQGSDPWFNSLEDKHNKFQLINGGKLGYNFQQFNYVLEYFLSKNFKINHVVIIFIGDDYDRENFFISDKTLSCLSFYKNCKNDEIFYAYPIGINLESYLDQIRLNRKKTPLFNKGNYFLLHGRIYNFLKLNFFEGNNVVKNRNALRLIVNNSNIKNKISFLHVSNKTESSRGKKSFMSEKVIKDILNYKINVQECKLELADYLIYDGHPNKQGYKKISDCVEQIIKNDNFSINN